MAGDGCAVAVALRGFRIDVVVVRLGRRELFPVLSIEHLQVVA